MRASLFFFITLQWIQACSLSEEEVWLGWICCTTPYSRAHYEVAALAGQTHLPTLLQFTSVEFQDWNSKLPPLRLRPVDSANPSLSKGLGTDHMENASTAWEHKQVLKFGVFAKHYDFPWLPFLPLQHITTFLHYVFWLSAAVCLVSLQKYLITLAVDECHACV